MNKKEFIEKIGADCPDCDNVGWYASSIYEGEQEQ